MSAVVVMLALSSDAETLRRAAEAFEEGLSLAKAAKKSRRQFQEAAALYEGITPRTPALWRAIGNARLLGGDRPGAVLAYRLGLREAPADSALRICLEAAREEVAFDGDLGRPGDDGSPAWPAWARFALAAMAWCVACAAGLRYAMTRARPWLWATGIGVVLACVLAGWWLSEATKASPTLAVVAADGTLLRRGDGEQFGSRYPNTLNRGAEAVVYRARGEWRLIGVGGGVGWVPASALIEESDTPR